MKNFGLRIKLRFVNGLNDFNHYHCTHLHITLKSDICVVYVQVR